MTEDRSAWYEIRDGRRMVRPYHHSFTSFAKRRWVGRRVLDVMADEFPMQCTEAYLAAAMSSQRLLLNGAAVRPEDTFRDGDKLEHIVVREEPSVPASPIQLLHCSEDLLVIDKPAGVPVHHAGRFRRNSLVEILQAERPEMRLADGGGARGGIHVLHRLDRQTSGVLLLPRTAASAAELGGLMQSGRLRKQYVARVRGQMPPASELVVREPVRVRSAHGATSCDCHADSKPACTRLRVLGYDVESDTSLLLCEPVTGRTHQIRLHARHLGHPVANDVVYGAPSAETPPDGAAPAADAPPAAAAPTAEVTRGSAAEGGTAKRARREGGRSAPGADAAKAAKAAKAAEAAEAAEAEAEELWLHARSYSCDEPAPGAPGFHYEAPLPSWAAPFLPLPPHAFAPLPATPPASPGPAPSAAASAEASAEASGGASGGAAAAAAAAAETGAVVALASTEGQQLLQSCTADDRAPFDALWRAFARQVGRTMCGPASLAMVLRSYPSAMVSADDGWEEGDVLGTVGAEMAAKMRRCGMTLPEMAEVATGIVEGVAAHPHHLHHQPCTAGGDDASAGSDDTLLAPLLAALRAPGSRVLLNYHMTTAGQPPFGGHFSPLAAYHASSRRFLVLDVWPDTEPCWLEAGRLCAAMRAVDNESGKPRGWVHIRC